MSGQHPPKELDAIVDLVLAYKAEAKSKPAKKRKKKAKKIAIESGLSSQDPPRQ